MSGLDRERNVPKKEKEPLACANLSVLVAARLAQPDSLSLSLCLRARVHFCMALTRGREEDDGEEEERRQLIFSDPRVSEFGAKRSRAHNGKKRGAAAPLYEWRGRKLLLLLLPPPDSRVQTPGGNR